MEVKSSKNCRLIIKKILLENFKSYYGKKEIGPFHPKFSSIMGPNGSGKSNLIDSLVFLFGKKASSIRLKNLKELIHNSKKHPDCQNASVEVIFQKIEENSEKKIKYLENTEFSLKRSINNKNESSYYIDSKKSTLKDINKKLSENDIDLKNNRFIILQGEIEEISLMKNKSGNYNNPGFLEYLDDIIGTIKYLEDIINLQNEFEELNSKKMEKSNLLMNFEKEISILRSGKDYAMEFLDNEKYLFKLKNFEIQRQILEVSKKVLLVENELMEIKNAKKNLENRSEMKKNEHQAQLNERKTLRNKISDLEDEILNLSENNSKDEKEFENINHNLRTIIKEYSNYKKENDILDEKISKVIDFYGESLIKISEKREIFKIKKKDSLEIKKLIDNLEPLYKDRIFSIREEMNLNEKKLIDIISKEKNIEENIIDLKENYNNYFYLKIENKKKIEEIIKKLNILFSKKLDNINLLKHSKGEEILLKSKIEIQKKKEQELSIKKLEIKQKINKLLKLKDNIEYNSRYKRRQETILKALLEGQIKGELSGIIGRVGDLARIDPYLEIAICSFAKSNLNKIVVNTLKNAQKAILFLKKNKIGKISFFILEKIQNYNQKINRNFLAPKLSKRIFDLLEISDRKYNSLFYLIFKDTLIAKNLSIAKKIAFSSRRRYNVVTHKGVVIEESGLFRDGDEKIRGLIKIKESGFIEEELDDFESIISEIENCKVKIGQFTYDINFLDETAYEDNKALGKILREKIKIEFRIKAGIFDIEKLEKDKNYLNSQNLENENKLKDLNYEQKLKLFNFEKQKINFLIENLENIKIDLKNKIDFIYGDDIKKYKIIDIKLKNEILTLNEEIIILEAKSNNLKIEEKKFLRQKKNINDEIKNIDLQIIDLKIKKEKLIKKSDEKNKQYEKKNDMKDNLNILYEKTETFFLGLRKFMYNLKKEGMKLKKIEEEKNIKKSKINYQKTILKENLEELRKNYEDIINEYNFLSDLEDIKKIDIKIEKIEEEKDNLKKFLKDITENYTDIEIDEKFELFPEIKLALKKTKLKLEKLKPNLNIIKEFKRKLKIYKEKKSDLDTLKTNLSSTKEKYYNLKKKRKTEFLIGFKIISKKLKETYNYLTQGGDAELELIDSLDPYSEGIEFTVRPPKKTWKIISKLSGGEKTLSSLSLIYAFHFFKPNCIYLMDEIDAALDYRNVKIVARFIKEKAQRAQFLVVSLRNDMFDMADCLVGVYKVRDVSRFMVVDVGVVGEVIGIEKRGGSVLGLD